MRDHYFINNLKVLSNIDPPTYPQHNCIIGEKWEYKKLFVFNIKNLLIPRGPIIINVRVIKLMKGNIKMDGFE